MKKQFIETGKIVCPFGVKGEVKVYPWSDTPEEVAALRRIYIKGGEKEYRVLSGRVHKDMVLLSLEGVGTVEDAEKLRNYVVYLKREDKPLKPGQYFYVDLIGMDVVDADNGTVYGTLSEITKGGSGEIYTVKMPSGREFMLPVIKETVIETDLDKNVMKIRPLKGLIEDED